MKLDPVLNACLLGILQRGITEARSLFLVGDDKKAAAILDALDNIPRHMSMWEETSESQIALQLQCFKDAYADHTTDYLATLEQRELLL